MSNINLLVEQELSPKQEAYREFFKSKLEQYKVDSPAKLSGDVKAKFFAEIKRDWRGEKRKNWNIE